MTTKQDIDIEHDPNDKPILDLEDVIFEKGTDKYKYKAYIPKDTWNKYRTDKPLNRGKYKIVTFGDPNYEQYKDVLGDWSHLDHKDKDRRQKYMDRHSKIKLKDGRYSYKVPYTKEFFSYYLLW